jgi:hypothetical protein
MVVKDLSSYVYALCVVLQVREGGRQRIICLCNQHRSGDGGGGFIDR